MYIVLIVGLILALALAREWFIYRKRMQQINAAAVPKVVSSGIYRSPSPRTQLSRTRNPGLTDTPILPSTLEDPLFPYTPTVFVEEHHHHHDPVPTPVLDDDNCRRHHSSPVVDHGSWWGSSDHHSSSDYGSSDSGDCGGGGGDD